MGRKKNGTKDRARSTESAETPRITPAKAKNAVKVSKVLAPTVVPMVAPLAVQAAGALRDAYDRYRAHKLGVDVESLGDFSGSGAKLHARIAGVAQGLDELRAGTATDPGVTTFIETTDTTLRQLTSAVRAAERMPAARRRAAHNAAARELDTVETQLLRHLGLT